MFLFLIKYIISINLIYNKTDSKKRNYIMSVNIKLIVTYQLCLTGRVSDLSTSNTYIGIIEKIHLNI